jgi:hypothetical protein
MWKEIVTLFVTQSLFLLALGWLARTSFVHFLASRLEAFKTELKMQAVEREIRFRRVDEKVANALSELYGKLRLLFDSVHLYVTSSLSTDECGMEERLDTVITANSEFRKCFFANRLYIPTSLFDRVKQDVAAPMVDIVNTLTRARRREERNTRQANRDEDAWNTAFNALQNDVSPVYSEIVAEFQRRIGVIND